MNRRGFLGSILALTSAAAVPALAKPAREIAWYQPWEVPGATLIGKTFTVDAPLNIASGVTIRNCAFNFTKPVKYAIEIKARPGVVLRNIFISDTRFEWAGH